MRTLMRMPLAALIVALVCILTPNMAGAVLLYATTGAGGRGGGFSSNLYTIDTTTHAVTLIGNTGLTRVAGIDFDSSGTLFATNNGSAGPSSLFILNPSTGAVVSDQGPIGAVQGVGSIAFDSSGRLWGSAWTGTRGALVTLNPATGTVLTEVLLTGSGNAFVAGLDFNSSGTLYGSRGNAAGHTEDLVTINTSTGVETAIGSSQNVIADIVFGSDGVLYGAQAQAGGIFAINPTTGVETLLFTTGLDLSGITEATAVPEPSSIALLSAAALASFGVGVSRRRRDP